MDIKSNYIRFDCTDAVTTDIESEFDALLGKADSIRHAFRKHPLPLFSQLDDKDDLSAMQALGESVQDSAKRIIVLGTGGSSLGGSSAGSD